MNYVKHPRIYHLPWSLGITDDDEVLTSTEQFKGKEIVITEKMDGENTTMYRDKIHARSIDSKSDPTRDWVKNLYSKIKNDIPKGWRVCGENLFAEHSIHYKNLPSYFMVHSIWIDGECSSWQDTEEFSELLGLDMVPKIYQGIWDESLFEKLLSTYKSPYSEEVEGYVVRLSDKISSGWYNDYVAKYVRKDHIKNDDHWFRRMIIPNELRKEVKSK